MSQVIDSPLDEARAAAYLIFGTIGGWSMQVLEGSLIKLELYDEVDDETPGEAMLEREERDAVRDCLGTLTDLQQESIQLAYYQGYTYNQVATLLDKPLPTIKTRMRDGLIRLRDCMGIQFGEVPQ